MKNAVFGMPAGWGKYCLMALLLLLTGCGFHLRGAADLPDLGRRIYLEGGSMALREEFRKVLRSANGELVMMPNLAQAIVRIHDERDGLRALSLSARGRSNELELAYHLNYSLLMADQRPVLQSQPVDIKRQYFNNQQDIIAKDNEQQIIHSEMLQQAARLMLERVRQGLARP